MEPLDLTCAKCGATWKLIKAGSDPIACPNCKAPVDGVPTPAVPPPSQTPASDVAQPAATPALPASVPDSMVAPEEPGIPATVRVIDVPDSLEDDYDDPVGPIRRRRGMNPVGRTIIVLLILIFLVPVALLILLFVVCAVLMSVR